MPFHFDAAAPIHEVDVVVRLALSFLLSAVIGTERSSRHQIAGMRTHILIALGSTFLMCLSIWLPQVHPELKNGDPGRIAAQVVSGIGFLGAGAMIRLGTSIRGLTTATSLWITAAIGMGIGAGLFVPSVVAAFLGLVALRTVDVFEKKFFPSERIKVIEIVYRDTAPDTAHIKGILQSQGLRVQTCDVETINGERKTIKLHYLVSVTKFFDMMELTTILKDTGDIMRIESQEKL